MTGGDVYYWLGLFMGLIYAYEVHSRHKDALRDKDNGAAHYPGAVADTFNLPLYILIISLTGIGGLFRFFADYMITVSIYNLIVLISLPFLRRYISAGACAVLWLVPACIVLPMAEAGFRRPLYILHIEETLIKTASFLWAAGMVLILLWKLVEHFLFRNRILGRAKAVDDPQVLEIWQEEMQRIFRRNTGISLMVSENVRTPLSVGVLKKSTVVVLPRLEYQPESLRMILRHELIHVRRGDGGNKLFLTVSTALCWFNPLMWYAQRKSSEDFELSCDEAVLAGEDLQTRKRYAGVVLDAAGDSRGFSSCLSAAASTMRYRLKRIVKDRKTSSGALVVFLAFLILWIGFGCLAVSSETTDLESVVCYAAGEDWSAVETVRLGLQGAECADTEALRSYFASLSVSKLASQREEGSSRFLTIHCADKNGEFDIVIRRYTVVIEREGESPIVYYMTGAMDRTYLESLFV